MNGLYSCTGINNSINGIQQGYDNRLMNPYVYIMCVYSHTAIVKLLNDVELSVNILSAMKLQFIKKIIHIVRRMLLMLEWVN